jgi:PAS domain S-box-containing protein
MERRWLLQQSTLRRFAVPGILTGGGTRWRQLRPYVAAAAVLALAAASRMVIVNATGLHDLPFGLFFVAVVVAVAYGGIVPGVVTAIAAAVIVNVVFFGSGGQFTVSASTLVASAIVLGEMLIVSAAAWLVRDNLMRLNAESVRRDGVADISAHALSGATSENLIDRCLILAQRELGCEAAHVWLANEDGTMPAIPGPEPQLAAIAAVMEPARSFMMPSRAWVVPAAVGAETAAAGQGPCAGAVALIAGTEQPLGVISVSTTKARSFPPSDLALLQTTAALLSSALLRDRYTDSLRRNESRLREVTDMAPMFIWIANAEGRLAFFNRRLLAFTGKTLEEQVSAGWDSIVHHDDLDAFLAGFRRTSTTGEPIEVELRLRAANGQYFWFLNRAVAAPGPDGKVAGYIGSSIDITDRRRAMHALRAIADLGSELSSSLDQAEIGRVITRFLVAQGLGDVAVVSIGGHDGRFGPPILCHDDGVEHPAEEITDAFTEEGDDSIFARTARLNGPGVLFPAPEGAAPLDRTVAGRLEAAGCARLVGVPLSARGRTVGALALLGMGRRSIAEPWQLQLTRELAGRAALAIDNAGLYAEAQRQGEELQRSNESLQFLADAGVEFSRLLQDGQTMQRVAERAVPNFADIAVIDVLQPDGALERLGIAASTPRLSRLVREIPSVDGFGGGPIARQLRSGHSAMISRVRPRHIRLFAQYAGAHALVAAIDPRSALFVPMTARGQVLGLLTFIRVGESNPFTSADLIGVGEQLGRRSGLSVDNARLFASSQAREAELREANVAKDEFLGLMSHELRTPITVIDGGARILSARGETLPSDARAEIVSDIAREAARLSAMLEDLLALARMELNQLSVVEPVLLHRAIARMAETAAPPRHEVRLSIEPGLPPVGAEPAYVEHVFRNLMSNAAKYSPDDSVIDVTVTGGEDSVEVRVLDRGPGVPESEVGHIFERFFRARHTARLASGAGMGLAVCKRLVEAMAGDIWAAPRDGGGLEVGFRLPLYHEEDL